MTGKILVVSTCEHELHYFEFVRPVTDILENACFEFKVVPLAKLGKNHLAKAEKIIICGTSLKDFGYLKLAERLSFLKSPEFEKPVLGICAGMQLLCLQFGAVLEKNMEIGLADVFFSEKFLGLESKMQAYSLHNSAVKDSTALRRGFSVFARSEKCIQVVRHLQKPFYGVLFHPEARQKELIENFAKCKL